MLQMLPKYILTAIGMATYLQKLSYVNPSISCLKCWDRYSPSLLPGGNFGIQ